MAQKPKHLPKKIKPLDEVQHIIRMSRGGADRKIKKPSMPKFSWDKKV